MGNPFVRILEEKKNPFINIAKRPNPFVKILEEKSPSLIPAHKPLVPLLPAHKGIPTSRIPTAAEEGLVQMDNPLALLDTAVKTVSPEGPVKGPEFGGRFLSAAGRTASGGVRGASLGYVDLEELMPELKALNQRYINRGIKINPDDPFYKRWLEHIERDPGLLAEIPSEMLGSLLPISKISKAISATPLISTIQRPVSRALTQAASTGGVIGFTRKPGEGESRVKNAAESAAIFTAFTAGGLLVDKGIQFFQNKFGKIPQYNELRESLVNAFVEKGVPEEQATLYVSRKMAGEVADAGGFNNITRKAMRKAFKKIKEFRKTSTVATPEGALIPGETVSTAGEIGGAVAGTKSGVLPAWVTEAQEPIDTAPSWVTTEVEEPVHTAPPGVTEPEEPIDVSPGTEGRIKKPPPVKGFNEETHTLADFIRFKGGINPGEFKAEALSSFSLRQAGYNLLNYKTGHSIDQMRMFAEEEGFDTPETSGDFLDLIKKDVDAKKWKEPGQRVWHPGKQNFDDVFANMSGGGEYASTGRYKTERQLIKLPEIVELAKELLGGKYPTVKKMLKRNPAVAGVFYSSGEGRIGLKASIFADPGQAERTLAHEIGHLVDYLPDQYMSRGNILGRLFTLKKYLKGIYYTPDTNLGYTKGMINDELKKLTQYIKPFDENSDQKFTKYRYSSVELYADAFSTLINDPVLLERMAPTFTKGFFDYLDKKPEVKSLYEDIQSRLTDSRRTFNVREMNTREMFAKGEEAARERSKRIPGRPWIKSAGDFAIDEYSPVYRKENQAIKQGVRIAPKERPKYKIEESIYVGSEIKDMLESVKRLVLNPLQAENFTPEDLASALMHRRVINERSKIANPLGFNPEESTKHLNTIRERVGNERYKDLLNTADNYRRIRNQRILPVLRESGMYPSDVMEKIENNPYYTTFDVIEYMDNKAGGGSGVKGHIYGQTGTVKEIANPFTRTIEKDISILKAAKRTIAINKTVKFMHEFFPGDIKVAQREWSGKALLPVEPKDRSLGLVRYMKNGQIMGVYVDKDLSKALNYKAPGLVEELLEPLRKSNRIWKELFVGKRVGFWPYNIIKDFKAALIQTPGLTLRKFAPRYFEAIKPAYRDVFGIPDQVTREMNRGNMLISIANHQEATAEDTELERLLVSYGLSEKKWENNITKPFLKFWDDLGRLTDITEKIPKIAVKEYLDAETTLSQEEKGHIVRSRAGSPAFLNKGHPFLNNVLLFYNPAKEGWRSSIEAAKENPKEYARKNLFYSITPKVLMVAATYGLFGKYIKEIMDSASDSDKTNYTVIPLGKTDSGKAVYIRIPNSETERVVGGIFWKTINMMKKGEFIDIFSGLLDYTAGQAPTWTPSLNIPIDIWSYLVSKENPHDDFRGRPAVSDRIFKAGGWRSHKEFAKYLANQAGAGIIYRFKSDRVEDIKSELEKVLQLPIINDTVARFLKVTDMGKREQLISISKDAKKKELRRQLDVRGEIINTINSGKNEPEDVSTLYNKLVEEGKYTGTYSQFANSFSRYAARRYGKPEIDAIVYASSNAEKSALLKEYRKTMSEKEYKELINSLVADKLVSPGLALSGE